MQREQPHGHLRTRSAPNIYATSTTTVDGASAGVLYEKQLVFRTYRV